MPQVKVALSLLVCTFLLFPLANANVQKTINGVETLDEENWKRILTGEWMIAFYAPWCPACRSLKPTWDSLAEQKKNLNIEVGKIDVTNAPGLSGRFMVTALPTIYHVINGEFRQYKSPRDRDTLVEFVSQKMWKNSEPISGWKNPTSISMSFVSYLFRMSQVLRGIHNKLMEDFGLPTWGSYLIFALATIIVGGLLGLIIVCVSEFIYSPKDAALQSKKKKEMVENLKDDLVDEEDSGSEKDKDNSSSPNTPNVRKRKPRKE